MLGPIETNEHLERRATSLRRTSVLEERNYQALATERAAAEAKLRKDLRAVALERWSEPLNPERQDRHEGLGEQHSIVQPRNSAPPSGVREIQAFRAFPEAEASHAPASSLANDGRRESRLPRGSGNLAAVVNQPGTSLGRRGSSQASVVEESSASRHSSPARGHYSSMTATRRHTEAGWNQPHRTEVPTLHPRHSSPPLSPGAQVAGSRLPRGHSPSLAAKDGHLYDSRRSSQDVHTAQSQSSGGSFGRQKAPSFSWPGTSSFTAEVKHPSTTRKASVSSVYQPSSLGRARAATEAGLPSDRSRQRFLSVPDVSDTRRVSHNTGGSASRHNTPPRNGELEAPHHESEGSETSSSESPEEAALPRRRLNLTCRSWLQGYMFHDRHDRCERGLSELCLSTAPHCLAGQSTCWPWLPRRRVRLVEHLEQEKKWSAGQHGGGPLWTLKSWQQSDSEIAEP